jgi:hypothetical protein
MIQRSGQHLIRSHSRETAPGTTHIHFISFFISKYIGSLQEPWTARQDSIFTHFCIHFFVPSSWSARSARCARVFHKSHQSYRSFNSIIDKHQTPWSMKPDNRHRVPHSQTKSNFGKTSVVNLQGKEGVSHQSSETVVTTVLSIKKCRH